MKQEEGQFKARHETMFTGDMLDRLLAREPEAVRLFIIQFTPTVSYIVNSIATRYGVVSLDDREDCVQECFCKIFEKLSHFDKSRNTRIETWAWTIANNRVYDELRSRRLVGNSNQLSIEQGVEQSGETLAAPSSSQPQEDLLARMDGPMMDQALAQLVQSSPCFARDAQLVSLMLELVRQNKKASVAILAGRLGCDPSTITRIKQRWETNGFLEALKSCLKNTGVLP